jgi:DNA-binding ferritin-like protein
MEMEDRITKIEEMIKEINEKIETLLHIPPSQTEGIAKSKIKEESPREFLLKFKVKTDTEKTLIAIHYLEEKGEENITTKEIENTLREMREKIPTNISDKIQLLDKRGFLKLNGQDGKRKNWLVSNGGEEFLRNLKNE